MEEKLPLRILPCPLDIAWNDPGANLAAVEAFVSHSIRSLPGVDPESLFFLFPELTLTAFVTRGPRVLEEDGPEVRSAGDIARRYRVAIGIGYPERNPSDATRPFNVFRIFSPEGKSIAAYRKIHLFTLGQEPETDAYASGSRGKILRYRGWSIGMSICFDLRFSALYFEYAKAKADLVLAPACWVGGPHKSLQLQTLGSAHAILGQCFCAVVNRSGRDPSFEFDGASSVFSPMGERLEENVGVSLDPNLLEKARALAVRPSDRRDYPVDVVDPTNA